MCDTFVTITPNFFKLKNFFFQLFYISLVYMVWQIKKINYTITISKTSSENHKTGCDRSGFSLIHFRDKRTKLILGEKSWNNQGILG